MNRKVGVLSAFVASLLALTALLPFGAAAATSESPPESPTTEAPSEPPTAESPSEPPNPTEEECQPGQPYNRHCPTIVTFEFPRRSFFEHGKVKLVHLGCNMSCNHVFFVVKHGKRPVAKGTRWPKGNYLPNIYTGLNGYAKKQLRRHKRLVVNARVCVHPPGPENFCKHHKIVLRKR